MSTPTILRLCLLCFVLAFIPVLVVANLVSGQEMERAQVRYELTAKELVQSTATLTKIENRLTRLINSVEAVEEEARRELRMVRPGEKFLLLDYEKRTAPVAGAQVAVLP